MNIIISSQRAAIAAHQHAARCFLFGQSYAMEAYDNGSQFPDNGSSLMHRARKFDELGFLFHKIAGRLDGLPHPSDYACTDCCLAEEEGMGLR